jgi:hypothetical protein
MTLMLGHTRKHLGRLAKMVANNLIESTNERIIAIIAQMISPHD